MPLHVTFERLGDPLAHRVHLSRIVRAVRVGDLGDDQLGLPGYRRPL